MISKILKLIGKDRLSIEKILNHKFFTKYFPNAENELIKPEGQINKIFIISTDNPKTLGKQNKLISNPISNNISNKTNSISNNNNRINNKIKNDIAKNYSSNIEPKYKKINVINQKKEKKIILQIVSYMSQEQILTCLKHLKKKKKTKSKPKLNAILIKIQISVNMEQIILVIR